MKHNNVIPADFTCNINEVRSIMLVHATPDVSIKIGGEIILINLDSGEPIPVEKLPKHTIQDLERFIRILTQWREKATTDLGFSI